jgi:hypothetical protein
MTDAKVKEYLRSFDLYGEFLRTRISNIEAKLPCGESDIREYLDVIMDLCDISGWVTQGHNLPPHILNLARKRIARLAVLTIHLDFTLKGSTL